MPAHKNYRRYSLRTVMLLVTGFCLWFGRQGYVANQQAEAIDGLRRLGGHAQVDGNQVSLVPKRSGNVESIEGARVVAINFLGPKSGDAEVEKIVQCIRRLPKIERISFTDTALTQTGERKIRAALPEVEITVIMTAFELQESINR